MGKEIEQKKQMPIGKSSSKGVKRVMEKNRYIRFDWAAKYMLRNKADFAIFEGLISVLVGEKVTIVELLESESNQEHRNDKFNRVDIKAKDSKGDVIIVEILYFDLGEGADYLYYGQTTLTGVHTHDTLKLTQHEREDLQVVSPEDVFPEYYIIRVNEFNQLATTPLEEWLQYLKDEYIRPDTTVPGLQEARERLEYLRMSPKDRRAYDYYVETLARDTDVERTKLLEAKIEGEKQGRTKGRAEGMEKGMEKGIEKNSIDIAKKMKLKGMSSDLIAEMTGLTINDIESL